MFRECERGVAYADLIGMTAKGITALSLAELRSGVTLERETLSNLRLENRKGPGVLHLPGNTASQHPNWHASCLCCSCSFSI